MPLIRPVALPAHSSPATGLEIGKEPRLYFLYFYFLTALDQQAEFLVRLARIGDHKEATHAFVEKRQPRFGTGHSA